MTRIPAQPSFPILQNPFKKTRISQEPLFKIPPKPQDTLAVNLNQGLWKFTRFTRDLLVDAWSNLDSGKVGNFHPGEMAIGYCKRILPFAMLRKGTRF